MGRPYLYDSGTLEEGSISGVVHSYLSQCSVLMCPSASGHVAIGGLGAQVSLVPAIGVALLFRTALNVTALVL